MWVADVDRIDAEDEEIMAKRMTVTLVATMMIVAALGFVKFKQIQTAIAQGGRVSAAARSGDDDRGGGGGVAGDADGDRHGGGRAGRRR